MMIVALFLALSSGVSRSPNQDDDAESQKITLAIEFDEDSNVAVVFVADGTEFSKVAAVVEGLHSFDVAETTLSVLPSEMSLGLEQLPNSIMIAVRIEPPDITIFAARGVRFRYVNAIAHSLSDFANDTAISITVLNDGSDSDDDK